MTGNDHTDALIEALRQPALPEEHAGERAAITAMTGAMTGAAAPPRRRSRKGIAIVTVTAASLGVGGLAAAGPGSFPAVLDFGRASEPTNGTIVGSGDVDGPWLEQADDTRLDTDQTDATRTSATMLDGSTVADQSTSDAASTPANGATPSECDGAAHGQEVSDAARSDEPDAPEVADVATDHCGQDSTGVGTDNPNTGPGNNNAGGNSNNTPAEPPTDNPNTGPGNNNAGGNSNNTPADPGDKNTDKGNGKP